jgi:hypothetical protein
MPPDHRRGLLVLGLARHRIEACPLAAATARRFDTVLSPDRHRTS